jgi:hypothetical protein
MSSTTNLDILPSGSLSIIRRHSEGIKTKAFRAAGGLRNSRIHLPVRGGAIALGASDEPAGALALVREVAERRAGGVDEGAGGGARGDVGRVRSGEAQGAAGVDIDALAAGDGDVLGLLV